MLGLKSRQSLMPGSGESNLCYGIGKDKGYEGTPLSIYREELARPSIPDRIAC